MLESNAETVIYRAVDLLVKRLEGEGHKQLATILDHRLHKVAWTSGSELLEELRHVLTNAMQVQDEVAATFPRHEICELISMIDSHLTAR